MSWDRHAFEAAALIFAVAGPVAAQSPTAPDAFGRSLRAAAIREADRLARAPALSASHARQSAAPRPERSWAGRHPVLVGTLIGFTGGFLIGYLPGDDAVFDDFVASFNGLVVGGIGAGVGAAVGGVVGAKKP